MHRLANTIKKFNKSSKLLLSNYDAVSVVLSTLVHETNKILVVVPSSRIAKTITEQILSILPEKSHDKVIQIDQWDASPFTNTSPSILSQSKRLSSIIRAVKSRIAITSVNSYLQKIATESFEEFSVRTSMELDREFFLEKLSNFSYEAQDDTIDYGNIQVRGSIVDIFPPHLPHPIRVEFDGDEVERIAFFNQETGRSIKTVPSITLYPLRELKLSKFKDKEKIFLEKTKNFRGPERLKLASLINEGIYIPNIEFLAWMFTTLKTLPEVLNTKETIFINPNDFYTDELNEELNLVGDIKLKAQALYDFSLLETPDKLIYTDGFSDNINEINILSKHLLLNKNDENELTKILEDKNTIISAPKHKIIDLSKVLNIPSKAVKLHEILQTDNKAIFTTTKLKSNIDFFLDNFKIVSFGTENKTTKQNMSPYKSNIDVGDYVIHEEHGVGIFKGFETISTQGITEDFAHIQYAGTDKLFVSVQHINKIKKYKPKTTHVNLDKLGSKSWQKKRKRAKEGAEKLAVELLEIYARRKTTKAYQFFIKTPDEEEKLWRSFPYQETPDQEMAINSTLDDMEKPHPMDRIICGDVGFGKTEVAIRATFRAVSHNKQVAVLVPTTLLALQHEKTFKKRFKDYPISIEALGRFKTPKEQKNIKEKLKRGEIDVIISTHSILGSNISFKDLGLLIIDEEHKFGVNHKEKLKHLAPNVDILTLTATPIPRTLNMAISGIKEISFLKTPPTNRLPIRTLIVKNTNTVITQAIQNELKRGGQVFFLHNRAQELGTIKDNLQSILPNIKIGIAHGQMPSKELEQTVLAFYNKEIDVLVCTSIIESGLDIPNANTLIVDRADLLGLSQLHQIRGRIGRSNKKAYCYLLLPKTFKFSKTSMQRLKILQKFSELGAGFHISHYDLELRGAGEFLGKNQSGFIEDVGLEEYMEMIQDAIKRLNGTAIKQKNCDVKITFLDTFIPKNYISSTRDRIEIYKRLAIITSNEELAEIRQELLDRFGQVPPEVENLLYQSKIKILAGTIGARQVTINNTHTIVNIANPDNLNIDMLVKMHTEGKIQLNKENQIKYSNNDTDIKNIVEKLDLFVRMVRVRTVEAN